MIARDYRERLIRRWCLGDFADSCELTAESYNPYFFIKCRNER